MCYPLIYSFGGYQALCSRCKALRSRQMTPAGEYGRALSGCDRREGTVPSVLNGQLWLHAVFVCRFAMFECYKHAGEYRMTQRLRFLAYLQASLSMHVYRA